MMHKTADFPYYDAENVQVLGLPYKSPDLAMFVFLPKERFGLAKFEKDLTGEKLLDLIKLTHQEQNVIVRLDETCLLELFML